MKLTKLLRSALQITVVTFVFIGAIFLLVLGSVYTKFDGDAELPADCALVFGAAIRRGSEPGPGILRRTNTAVWLYHNDQVNTLIMTGGKGSADQDSEAEVMRQVALDALVPLEDIRIEDQSRSTWENLLYSKPIIEDCTSVVGVSDRYHLRRIQYLAHLQEWGRISVHPASPTAGKFFEFRGALRETLGIIYYTLRDFIPSGLRLD